MKGADAPSPPHLVDLCSVLDTHGPRTTSTIPASVLGALAIGLRADASRRRYVPVAPAQSAHARGSPMHRIEVRFCEDAALDVRRLFWA